VTAASLPNTDNIYMVLLLNTSSPCDAYAHRFRMS